MNALLCALYGAVLAGTAAAAPADGAAVSPGSTAATTDSAVTDTAASADTAAVPGARKAALEDSVRYSADTIRFFINEQKIRLTGHAVVSYQGITLKAHSVILHSGTRNLDAAGRYALEGTDTVWTGTPVLTDKEGSIEGFRMVYNLETRRGRIIRGSTSFEEGRYKGTTVALVGHKELNTSDGDYTTCDHDDPHYTFHSRRMKLYINDKAILKPVTLSFREVPVIALPFYILPLKRGRHSGLLMPTYGEDTRLGKYLKNIGYYYAPGPYWDAKLAMAFYSSAYNRVEGAFRYKLRYVLQGNVKSSFLSDASSASATREWDVAFNHSHELAPGLSMRANGEFASTQSYLRDYQDEIEDRKQELRSNAYISWKGAYGSANLSAGHTKTFLEDGTTTDITLPSATYSKSGQLFPGNGGSRTAWYRKLRYSYSNKFLRTLAKETDTTETDTAGYAETRTWTQSPTLSYNGTLLPWLHITPSLGYNEKYNHADGASASQQGTYTLKTDVNTTLYGMFPVGILALEVLRHTVTPSLSVSYKRTLGTKDRTYRPFAADTYGDPVRSLGVSLGNLFQAKLNRDSTVSRIDLLTGPNISTSYNFDTELWNNVSTTMKASLGKLLTLNVNFTHSLYAEGSDRPLVADGSFPLRELSRTVSLSTNGRTNGSLDYYDDIQHYASAPGYTYAGLPVTTVQRPWQLGADYRIVHTVADGTGTKTQNLSGSAGLNLTLNLKAAYTATYDPENGEFLSQQIELYRDLHCWEARLRWTPTGYRKGFFFKVNVREIPDVKVEQSIKYE